MENNQKLKTNNFSEIGVLVDSKNLLENVNGEDLEKIVLLDNIDEEQVDNVDQIQNEKLEKFEKVRGKIRDNIKENQQIQYKDHQDYKNLKIDLDREGVLPKNPIASDKSEHKNRLWDTDNKFADKIDNAIDKQAREEGYTNKYLDGLSVKQLEYIAKDFVEEEDKENLEVIQSKIAEIKKQEEKAYNKVLNSKKIKTRFDGNYSAGIAPNEKYQPKRIKKLEQNISDNINKENVEESKFLEKFRLEQKIAEKIGIKISLEKIN